MVLIALCVTLSVTAFSAASRANDSEASVRTLSDRLDAAESQIRGLDNGARGTLSMLAADQADRWKVERTIEESIWDLAVFGDGARGRLNHVRDAIQALFNAGA